MTYAGRLDPMARGLLLVLVGEEVKNKDKYLKLDKEYEFEILVGFATDTYDILGKIQHSHILENVGMLKLEEWERDIRNNLKHFRRKFTQKYPIYSSKTVKGKQLWQYGRNAEEVEIPEREVSVKKLQFLKIRRISAKKLLEVIERRIKKVEGHFRQKEIIKLWRKHLVKDPSARLVLANFKIKCSSGTYVRGIAHSLGEKMGAPALAFSIKRTTIGKFGKISGWKRKQY